MKLSSLIINPMYIKKVCLTIIKYSGKNIKSCLQINLGMPFGHLFDHIHGITHSNNLEVLFPESLQVEEFDTQSFLTACVHVFN